MHPDQRLLSNTPRIATASAAIAAAIGALALAGWVFGISELIRPIDDLPAVEPLPAIGLLCLAAELWLMRAAEPSETAVLWARILGAIVIVGALAVLAEWAFDTDLGVHRYFDDPAVGGDSDTRPSPPTAVAAGLCAAWLLLPQRSGRRWDYVATVVGGLACTVVIATAVAYLYDVDYVWGRTEVTGVAPAAIVALAALCAGTMAARPASPWMQLLLATGSGGHTLRRLLPAMILIPVIAGFVLVVGDREGAFSVPAGATILCAIAIPALAALVIYTAYTLDLTEGERRGLERQLAELSDRDPLTNLFNGRRLDDELRRQLALTERHGVRLAVLSIDLDGFKEINDSYGPATGDELLLATAEVLTEELRASDVSSRPGDDEFVVLLPETDSDAARIVAGKLIRAFRGVLRPRPGGGVIELRASVGIAVAEPGSRLAPAELMEIAHRALYAAKQAGGDRFTAAEALVLE